MKRYLVGYNSEFSINNSYDVVIVGAGIAGLYTALMLPRSLKIGILSKKEIENSDSYLAQGGIAASINEDNRASHIEDTLNAGCYVNNVQAVETLVYESEEAIKSLMKLGVEFDRDSSGKFHRSLEGNHSFPRILHVNGDATGKGIMEVLIKRVGEAKNINVVTDAYAIDIIENDEGQCSGVSALCGENFVYFKSRYCVMASGGIGQIYSKTTNRTVLTGDGIAMAIRAGVKIENMQYVQFHPTAFCFGDLKKRMFLISEAVRGEGAVLRNTNKKRFMQDYDKRMELAPRDIVARAIENEICKSEDECVYLDATMYDGKFLKNRFATIYKKCRENNINMEKDYIPVTPAEHYFMGGIKTDIFGKTSMDRLYAVGECSCTGVHGANRLASNSLMEALVFGERTAVSISNKAEDLKVSNEGQFQKNSFNNITYDVNESVDFNCIKRRIKDTMEKNAGIIRRVDKLKFALDDLKSIEKSLSRIKKISLEYIEAYNMCLVSDGVVSYALESRKSVGSNYVVEYSKTSN